VQKTNKQNSILEQLRQLIKTARSSVSKHVDKTMTFTYFTVGWYIIENEQEGEERAKYASETLSFLGKELSKEFGKGFSARNLALMKKFYLTYQNRLDLKPILQIASAKLQESIVNIDITAILQNVSAKSDVSPVNQSFPFMLSWSHYVFLCTIKNEGERRFYEIEAIANNWILKELERQYNSSLYERLALSRNKIKVKQLSEKGQVIESPNDTIKNPLVLEFLGLKEDNTYTETDLETAIINRIEHFLMELGKGFLFQGRQVRFSFEEEHYFVDLVFYNRLLRCFVLVDLKIGKLKHQDIGQMQMYVNYYDRFVKTPEENKTVGIIICKNKKDAIVELTLPENNEQIFASRYQLYLPSKEELQQLIKSKEEIE